MGPPDGLVYQGELPFERDAVQCCSGRWRYVRFRKAPAEVFEAGSKEDAWRIARSLADRPVWEEHYEGLTMIGCTLPPEVFRHPQTCFLVTDGSPRPSKAVPEHPDSHVRLKVKVEPPPETPRSAGWQEERVTDWKRVKDAVVKKIRGL